MFLILTLGALSIVLALVVTPLVRDLLGKRFLDHPDGIRKKHATPVPRVGGIAIVLSYVITFAIALALPFTYTQHLHHELPNIVPLTLVAAVVFFTGVLDDLIGLAAWQKLLGILGASVLAYFSGIHVEIRTLQGLPAWPWLGFAITVIWLVGCSNAFNLIDGMDGLAAGVGLFATITMLLAALTQNNIPLMLATMPLAGCLLGFLRYNFSGASVYLGDCGSLTLGFMLGCFGALWSEKSVTLVALDGASAGGFDSLVGCGALHPAPVLAQPAHLSGGSWTHPSPSPGSWSQPQERGSDHVRIMRPGGGSLASGERAA